MATNEGFDKDPLSCGGFSHLINSGDVVGLEMTESFIFPPSFSVGNTPTTLCFGNDCSEGERRFGETGLVTHKSGTTGCDSSSASSSNNSNSSNSVSKSKRAQSGERYIDHKNRNRPGPCSVPCPGSGASVVSRRTCKKPKAESTTSTGPSKGRKEKLGERITALQQLVSPFGKTDTASVLHEAMGYIRFLHDQVQVLSSPYLQRLPSSAHKLDERGGVDEDETKYDLRSRGLCLVPVACTVQVAKSNGADFWSPAMGSTSSKH